MNFKVRHEDFSVGFHNHHMVVDNAFEKVYGQVVRAKGSVDEACSVSVANITIGFNELSTVSYFMVVLHAQFVDEQMIRRGL